MRKVAVISSNRSDFSKLEPVVDALEGDDTFCVQLILLGSHLAMEFGRTYEEIGKRHKIAAAVHTLALGDTPGAMSSSVGMTIMKLTSLFEVDKPDIVVVHGDRFDAFGCAVAASMMSIPICHVEGGELSGSIDGSLRHAITKLSHVHFVANDDAERRVLAMGEDPRCVHLTGCPSYDRFFAVAKSLDDARVTQVRAKWHPRSDGEEPFLIVIHHPTTTDLERTLKEFDNILRCVEAIAEAQNLCTLLFYPNVDVGNKSMLKCFHRHQRDLPELYLKFVRPVTTMPYEEFMVLLRSASCCIGNSSAGVREACLSGTSVVNVGNRQHGRRQGHNVSSVSGTDFEELHEAVRSQIECTYEPSMEYGDGNAVGRVVDILRTCSLDPLKEFHTSDEPRTV